MEIFNNSSLFPALPTLFQSTGMNGIGELFSKCLNYTERKCFPERQLPGDAVLNYHFPNGTVDVLLDQLKGLPEHLEDWSQDQLNFFSRSTLRLKALCDHKNSHGWQWKDNAKISRDPKIKEILRLGTSPFIKCKNFLWTSGEKLPIKILDAKIDRLMQLKNEGKLHEVTKAEKLTFREFHFVSAQNANFDLLSADLKNKFIDFRKQFCFIPHDQNPIICFWKNEKKVVNLQNASKLEMTVEHQNILIRLCIKIGKFIVNYLALPLHMGMNLFANLFIRTDYFHANIVLINDADVGGEVVGVGDDGFYKGLISGRASLMEECYRIDFKRLAHNLPENYQEKVEEWFKDKFIEVVSGHHPLKCDGRVFSRICRKFLGRLPVEKPEEIKIKPNGSYQNMWCSEFVLRSLIETTCRLYDSLEKLPPDNISHFGFDHDEPVTGVTPGRLREVLVKAGILVPAWSVDDFVGV